MIKQPSSLFFFLFPLLIIISAYGDSWSDQQNIRIKNIPENPSFDDLMLLCALSASQSINKDRVEVASSALTRLRSIPDFHSSLNQHLQAEKLKWKTGGWSGKYDSRRFEILNCLGSIPDPRVVVMLGDLLTDTEWTRDPVEHALSGADYSLTPPNSLLAARSLAKLIEQPPIDKDPDNYLEIDVEPWISWYASVRQGVECISFKGETVKYRFYHDGSWEAVDQEKPSGSVNRGKNGATRPEPRPNPNPSAEPEPRSHWRWPVLMIVLSGSAGLLWVFRNTQSRIKR